MEQAELKNLPTEEKILYGTRSALAQYGLGNLSMIDISRAAGVSKATLYRHFPTKDAVLNAFCLWEEKNFCDNLSREMAQADPADRFSVLIAHSSTLSRDHPAFMRMLESDPAFVLSAMRTLYPTVKDHLYTLLIPVIENVIGDGEQDISVEQLTHCFVRILITSYLFPDEPGESTEGALRALFQKVSGSSISDQ